jgi:hypothetical protein
MEEKVILRKMLDECTPDLHMSEDSVYISFHSDKGKFWWTDRLSVKRNDNWVNVHSSFDIDKFKNDCSDINVKPIAIDLEINDGSILKDVMTSSKHFGDNRTSYEESERICSELRSKGYKVLRNKIESVPWHPSAPVISTGKEIPNGCYFESHIGVVIRPDEKEDLNTFIRSTLTNGQLIELSGTAKLSQNFFKKSKDGSKFVNMLTYRSNMCGSPKFKLEVEGIKQLLIEEGFEFEKVEVEYAIYDTNVSHDAKWINNDEFELEV